MTNPSRTMSNTPVEILEAQQPVRVDAAALVPDSGGAGRWRGGLGLRRRHTLLAEAATLPPRSDRQRVLPYGLARKGPASGTRNVLDPGGAARVMPGQFAITLRRGDTFLHEQPSDGGHGDPLDRDPARVAADGPVPPGDA